jgi:hypothetical protein
MGIVCFDFYVFNTVSILPKICTSSPLIVAAVVVAQVNTAVAVEFSSSSHGFSSSSSSNTNISRRSRSSSIMMQILSFG